MPATVRSRPSRPADASSGGTPKPRTDAYVGLLVISLLAQIAGAVFLYLEYSSYPGDKKPPAGPPRDQRSPSRLVKAERLARVATQRWGAMRAWAGSSDCLLSMRISERPAGPGVQRADGVDK